MALQDAVPRKASLRGAAIQARVLGKPAHPFLFLGGDLTRWPKGDFGRRKCGENSGI